MTGLRKNSTIEKEQQMTVHKPKQDLKRVKTVKKSASKPAKRASTKRKK